MADEKPKKAAAKKPKAKPKAKRASAKSAETKNAATKAKKDAAKKPAPKKSSAKAKKDAGKKAAPSKPKSVGIDKSLTQLRDSLEHSVTLSRDRIQEVVDDAVKRGRMTHGDAEKMIGELLKRGRKQTDALLSELEKLVRQARRKLP
jgi:polyhydroxyalkanoate synthesis regulator phasin